MTRPAVLPVLLAACLLAGCVRQVPLAYVPTGPLASQAQAVVGQVTVTDQRGESDPTWIGAVRGGYGNPLKVLHTSQPLADMVNKAFRDALATRGLLAPNGAAAADLAVTIVQFDSTQYVRREANVDFIVELRDHASGRQLYRDEVKSNPIRGSIVAFDVGVFGSADDLQAVAQAAMDSAIDAALNKPAFAAALGRVAQPGA